MLNLADPARSKTRVWSRTKLPVNFTDPLSEIRNTPVESSIPNKDDMGGERARISDVEEAVPARPNGNAALTSKLGP